MMSTILSSSLSARALLNMAAQGVSCWLRPHMLLLLICLSEALSAAPEINRDYYDTLHVKPTATDREIKKSFRKLAVKYHPDKNKSADAESTFREIAEAYRVLSNKEQRRLYDRVGHKAFLKNEDPVDSEDDDQASFHFSFPDFFHDFDDSPFGGEWRFHQEEEDGHYGQYSFERQRFSFYFGDADDYEDEYYF
ncbi:dnaJ homolog subfamily B member 9-like [Archocentrus centrarchus]|uniref:dnaJ homolog subfamily B member 9-like n=1 Tax=Archocentrus centrarchus TaxID=63155 RepID=UPI0011E9CE9E|nr:dnaJ homolog subfamily B member 9-like [Archocentrus centrarchus]